MKTQKYMKAAALAAAMMIAGSSTAFAAKQVKPMLKANGMLYFNKVKAQISAKGRWEKKAARKYGLKFSHWSRAKKRSIVCDHKMKNARKLFRCQARAKPVGQVTVCKTSKITSKWRHPNKSYARKTAYNNWGKLAAQHFGTKYSFWKKAKNKYAKCKSKFKNGKFEYTCTLKANPCK